MPKIEMSQKYIARNGTEVVLITTQGPLVATPVVGYVCMGDAGWKLTHWSKEGVCPACVYWDLAPKKQAIWVNIYPEDVITGPFHTNLEARNSARKHCIATVKVEYYPGEGLDKEKVK